MTDEPKLSVTVKLDIPWKLVADSVCNVLDMGGSYCSWLGGAEYEPGGGMHAYQDAEKAGVTHPYADVAYWSDPRAAMRLKIDRATSSDQGDHKGRFSLNRASIAKGIAVMARDHGQHFDDWMRENGDICTDDVFMQCCVYGEVIYG